MTYQVPDYGRYCLTGWCLLSGTLSLLGNLTLLFSSLVANALKLDRVSVILIQNLAATGVGYTIFIILPTAGSALTERWVYGTGLCVATSYLLYVLGFMNTYLVGCLNLSKLTVMLFPLRARLRSRRCGYLISAALWFKTTCLFIVRVIWFDRDVTFNPLVFTCSFDYRKQPPGVFERVMFYVNVVTPFGVILVTAGWLMMLIRRVRTLTRQGVVALLVVSVAYILSYLPFLVFPVVREEPMTVGNLRHFTVASVSTYTSFFLNPVIFYFTVTSFKSYVDRKLGRDVGRREARNIRDFSTRMSTLRGSMTSGIVNSSQHKQT
ncbi:hypothetical protein ACHWQZ_G004076 [Mnemiopsis leidyi]